MNLYRLFPKPYGPGSRNAIDTHFEMVSFQTEVKVSQSQWKHWNTMYHIGLLIMAAMTYLAPDFIKEGRLCWLRSPLYIVESGKKRSYYFNDAEFNTAKAQGKVKGEVHRAKGLGALEPDEAHESMFTPEYQRLDVLMPDEKSFSLLQDLMGKNVTPRTEFIFKNIDFSEIRE